jgi:hypothetical protein
MRGLGAAPTFKFINKRGSDPEYIYAEFNTNVGNGYFNLSDVSGDVQVHLSTETFSTFLGANLQGHALQNVKTILLNPQSLLTIPIPDTLEYDNTDVWMTNSAGIRKKLGGFDIETTFSALETTDKTLIGSINELFTNKEVAGVASELISNLKDGVSSAGDTLQKLYNLIVGSFSEVTVSTIAARDAFNVDHLPMHIFVTDDGDGRWSLYKATTTGVGATFIKISDPDLLNAVMTASQIKTAYESNSDTNAFSNALLAKLNSITAIFTTALKAAYDSAVTNSHASGSDNQTASTVPIVASGFNKNLNSGITNVQLLANAVDQLSAGSNGIPNPIVYTYTGGVLIKEIETIIGGTIEKRYRYYSGGSAQDGSMDIAEIQNTVTGDFKRVTCVYTGGYITSRSLTTITTFSI